MKILRSDSKLTSVLLSGALLAPVAIHADEEKKENVAATPHALVVQLMPTSGSKTRGAATFSQTGENEVTMTTRIMGLKPGAQHAIHIHEFGDLSSADGTSAGDHFNPKGHPHGLPDVEARHAGDLGNVTANADGETTEVKVIKGITLTGEMNPILGRALVIHEGEDKGTQPAGDAGGRIAVGVIGYANPESVRPRSDREDVSDSAEEAVDSSLEVKAEKAIEKTGDALGTALKKTEEGIKKAAEKTEEAIEDAAQ